MARVARGEILYDGCYGHIISRSMRKEKVFQDREDFELFRRLLIEVKRTYYFRVYHYCLMHTHFHLAVAIPNVDRFSKGLHKLKSQYIFAFHKKYKISGPVWRERYKSLLIENEPYLYVCGRYIESNPVRAGLVEESRDWEYSSSRCYLEGARDDAVDKYELSELPEGIDSYSEAEFERGYGIGSDYFKFKLRQKLK